jgi:uncharacterized protein (TIGR03118 family)
MASTKKSSLRVRLGGALGIVMSACNGDDEDASNAGDTTAAATSGGSADSETGAGADEASRATAAESDATDSTGGMEDQFVRSDLISDEQGRAVGVDPHLVDAWGIAVGPGAAIWVANNGTGTATLYDADGVPQPAGDPLVVALPAPAGSRDAFARPTGSVRNPSPAFEISAGEVRARARFLFATEQGTILGWNPVVDRDHAVVAVDNSSSDAVYKGLAIAHSGGSHRLYATNFRSGRVEVFDGEFGPAHGLVSGAFEDPEVPAGYGPFGIQRIDDEIYVSHAKQDVARRHDVAAAGAGHVSVFTVDGELVARLEHTEGLDAPWAMIEFNGMLMIGNFGDGKIAIFDPETHAFVGYARDAEGVDIAINGLWGLASGADVGRPDTLYFTAGPNSEALGLFGSLVLR